MKRKLALIITVVMMLLFSCTEPSLQETPPAPETPQVTPEVEASIQTQINDTISRLGIVSRVYSNSSAITPSTSSRALVSSKTPKESVTVDGKQLDRYSVLVEYDTVTGEIAEHLKKLTSSDDGSNPRRSFNFSTIGGKVYVEYRFHYFAGTTDLAFMEVRMYDNLAMDTSFKVTEFSKDFIYDIINQVRMTDGAKVGYNWEKQEEKDADRFVPITEDMIPPFRPELRNMWVLMDDDDEIVTHSYSAGMYLQEITLTEELSTFFRNPAFSAYTIDGNPDLDGYNGDFNQNSAYILIKKYPPRFRSAYSIWAYWFENGSWNATMHAYADENYRIKNWKPVTEDATLSEVRGIVSFMGTPTHIYQQYIGDEKITRIWNSDLKGAYLIEFSSFKDGAKTAASIFNPSGREEDSSFIRSAAGQMAEDTVATVELLHYANSNTSAVIKYKNGDKVYNSYRWLLIAGNTINGMDVDNPPILDDQWISLRGSTDHYDLLAKEDYPVPVFGNPNRIWLLKDQNGEPVTARHTAAFYIYELPMTFQDKAFLEEYQDGDTDNQDLMLNGFGYAKAKKDCFYASVMPTPPDHRTPCFIDFAWWDGEGWQHTIQMQTDEQRHMMIWKDIDSSDQTFGPLYESIEKNIGKIESVKQLYAGNDPRLTVWEEPVLGDYVLELETVNPKLRKAIINPNFRRLFSLYYSEAGKLDDDTVCTMHVLYYNDNRITASIMIYGEDEDGSWDNSYSFLSCSKDFSTVNGICLDTANVPDKWIKTNPYAKGEYVEIDNNKAGFYTADRIWEKEFTPEGPEISRHIIAIKPNAEIRKLTERYKMDDRVSPYLNIDGFTYQKAAPDSIYVDINKLRSRYSYFLKYYWHENGEWHNTISLRATDNQIPLTWEDATDSTIPDVKSLKEKLSKIGTISKVYLRYEGDKPFSDKSDKYSYIVEFTDYRKNIIPALDNNNERVDRNIWYGYSEAGKLSDNTRLAMQIMQSHVNTYSSSFALRKDDGRWDDYYYYLNCGEDFSIINGFDINTGKKPDYWISNSHNRPEYYNEITDLLKPGFYNPDRVWELQDKDGNTITGNGRIAFHILEVSRDQVPLEMIRSREGFTSKTLHARGYTYGNADTNAIYVEVNHYQANLPYQITYNWYEDDCWHKTVEIKHTKEKQPVLYCNVTDSPDAAITELRNSINTNVGTISRIFQAEVEGKPYNQSYVVELNSTKENLLPAISYQNDKLKTGLGITTSSVGKLLKETTCWMEIQNHHNGSADSLFMLKEKKDSWTSSFMYLPCAKDFSVINSVDMNTGKPVTK